MEKKQKMEKLLEFASLYKVENDMNETDYNKLVIFFEECVKKKKLSRTKEVVYDKKMCKIKSIPGLMINKQNYFTIKNIDTKSSTIRCLNKKTIKNVKSNIIIIDK
jgi:hypothetical protein